MLLIIFITVNYCAKQFHKITAPHESVRTLFKKKIGEYDGTNAHRFNRKIQFNVFFIQIYFQIL